MGIFPSWVLREHEDSVQSIAEDIPKEELRWVGERHWDSEEG